MSTFSVEGLKRFTKKNPNESRFFSSSKKAEMDELRTGIQQANDLKQTEGVKQVIAAMSQGIDVSDLFPDVMNLIWTTNMELKKLVYLYLINYSKSKPDIAVMGVNAFVRDTQHENPMIRALAIRTMSAIRVLSVAENLAETLGRTLRDDDPYVRKTSAISVAKLFDVSPELVEDRGFIDVLRDMLSDVNHFVVSNAAAALCEISIWSGENVFDMNAALLNKILVALGECSEWGKIYILDSLALYNPQSSAEAQGIIERLLPLLQTSNSGVVMSVVRVIMSYLDIITDRDVVRSLSRKLAPPLGTLLESEPEIQYVALRNIIIIAQKKPSILDQEIKLFFCKYNDPIYVKIEKLEILVGLVNDRTIEQVLLELKEYAQEVDVQFVRKAVRAIGGCAIKLENVASRCIETLIELVQNKVHYVVQEAVIVIKDIFRRYPNQYESVIGILCDALDNLDEPEAKASMIWIIGEYADRIDNPDIILESFIDNFDDEPSQVQLQILTATVKLFLYVPETQELVQKVLQFATQKIGNPDLRDRAYIYWRLLSTDLDAAHRVILAQRPPIDQAGDIYEPNTLNQLIKNLGTLSAVHHKTPEQFVKHSVVNLAAEEGIEEEEAVGHENGTDYTNEDNNHNKKQIHSKNYANDDDSDDGKTEQKIKQEPVDLLGISDDIAPKSTTNSSLSPSAMASVSEIKVLKYTDVSVVDGSNSQGIAVSAIFIQDNGNIQLKLNFKNLHHSQAISSLAIQFNKNIFGIIPTNQQILFVPSINIGSSHSYMVPIGLNPQMINESTDPSKIQVAMKNISTGHVFYFSVPLNIDALFCASTISQSEFINAWRSLDESKTHNFLVMDIPNISVEFIKEAFGLNQMTFITQSVLEADQQKLLFFAVKVQPNYQVLVEARLKAGVLGTKISLKTATSFLSSLVQSSLEKILKSNSL